MTPIDLLRFTFFLTFGVGAAFMVATNVLAFRVLRPPKRIGFLWWHVTAVSVAFACYGAVALSLTMARLGSHADADWRTVVAAIGTVAFTASQAIIFNVERRRYVYQRSVLTGEVDLASPPRASNVW